MPGVGDQHKSNGAATANPFEEVKPRIAEYTAQEIATLQSRLDKQLGPEYISTRPGAGGQKVHYLAVEKAISLANEVFGFNGWSSSIQNIQIDFVDENPQTGKISLGLSVIMRVTLKDGTYHEDIGYGQIENCKGKAAAFEKAKKEGTTDALKRALRNFGNVLGNCIYDKSYLSRVTKVKVAAVRWDPDNLHRHADFAPKKDEEVKLALPAPERENLSSMTEFDDSFDLADFDEMDFNSAGNGHPDEIALPFEPPDLKRAQPTAHPAERMPPPMKSELMTPSKPPSGNLSGPGAVMSKNSTGSNVSGIVPQPLPGHRQPLAGASRGVNGEERRPLSAAGEQSQHVAHPAAPQTANAPKIAGFYSARAAGQIDANNNAISVAAPKFDPHAESPSIRKTSGIDHNKSMALKRDLSVDLTGINKVKQQQAEVPRAGPMPASPNMGLQSRGPSTSAYRPPTRRGGEVHNTTPINAAGPGGGDRVLQAARRPPLSDLSNVQHSTTAMTGDGVDAKRQKIGDSGDSGPKPAEGAAG